MTIDNKFIMNPISIPKKNPDPKIKIVPPGNERAKKTHKNKKYKKIE